MALPLTGITTSMVAAAIGEASNDVGALCTSNKINKWSKWKPVGSNKVTGLTEADIIAANCGLDRNPQTQEIFYNKPRGGTNNEYYRIGDFRNYNHLALPPVNIEIVSVTKVYNQPIQGPPYTLLIGSQYVIEFKLIPGDIDPTWINSQTNRVKNINPSGGYGGLTWVIGPGNPPQSRESHEVFSCEVLNPQSESQLLLITGTGGGIRMEYCRYLGDSSGLYETTGHYIEDDGFSESYRSLFTIRNVDAGINLSENFTLFWNSIANQLEVRIGLFNNEDVSLNVKLRLTYTRMETSIQYNYNGSPFDLPPNSNQKTFIPLQGWSNGTNSYEVRAWMYIVKPDLTEVEISYQMQTVSITISTDR